MKQFTVTIGIPAYNEEANIKKLLSVLVKQKEKNYKLEKILVISDASSDNTVSKAQSVKNRKIRMVDRKERMGGRQTKAEIFKRSKADILVVLDADVLPTSVNFIEEIIKPIINGNGTSLVGANTIPLPAKSFFEKVVADGHLLKKNIYSQINGGDNVYLCHGRARAFTKDLYKKINLANDCPEDAYSYLYAKDHGYKFSFAKDAKVWFRVASDFKERESQSKRFVSEINNLSKYFSKDFLRRQFKLPATIILSTFLIWALKKPLTTVSYLAWVVYLMLSKNKKSNSQGKWQMALTTKRL